MTIEQIKEMVAGSEYDFLRTNPHLKDRIIFDVALLQDVQAHQVQPDEVHGVLVEVVVVLFLVPVVQLFIVAEETKCRRVGGRNISVTPWSVRCSPSKAATPSSTRAALFSTLTIAHERI